ncbi:hypothetical protein TNCT_293001 [Trichonephila clavata]|uniref:DUF5641 domain-containing protein n=1 Tax=Trichonephila clavata TaxID=2740835 RepID=A0A8X6FP09_TRICU|nr:hypothetical protein TNCT_293001 [Trichonephila clavata]
MQYILGWTVMGKVSNEINLDSSYLTLSLFVNEAKITDLWNLDSFGINDPCEKQSKEEVLTRFRMGKIGATADIRKAFLSISLDDHDRDYMRFIWLKDGDPEKEIRTLSDPERRKPLISVTNTDNKRIDWPLARVIQLFPSKDGDVRLTKVKMKNGEFLGPIKIGLYPWSCLLNWMPPRTYDPDMDYFEKNEFEFFELEKLKVGGLAILAGQKGHFSSLPDQIPILKSF